MSDGTAAARSRRGAELLRRAGVTAPRELRVAPWRGRVVVVTEAIPGTPAAALISTRRERDMARAMGDVAARLRARVSPGEKAGPWSHPGALTAAAMAWAAAIEPILAGTRHLDLLRAAASASEGPWTQALSHGDFVPANALMIDDRVHALVDTGDVGPRHHLVDVAWWCLIVRHHHPAESPRLTNVFLTASGLGTKLVPGLLPSFAVLRCAELLSDDEPGKRGLEPLLRSAAVWLEESRPATT